MEAEAAGDGGGGDAAALAVSVSLSLGMGPMSRDTGPGTAKGFAGPGSRDSSRLPAAAPGPGSPASQGLPRAWEAEVATPLGGRRDSERCGAALGGASGGPRCLAGIRGAGPAVSTASSPSPDGLPAGIRRAGGVAGGSAGIGGVAAAAAEACAALVRDSGAALRGGAPAGGSPGCGAAASEGRQLAVPATEAAGDTLGTGRGGAAAEEEEEEALRCCGRAGSPGAGMVGGRAATVQGEGAWGNGAAAGRGGRDLPAGYWSSAARRAAVRVPRVGVAHFDLALDGGASLRERAAQLLEERYGI